jgi:hypothetical protein
MVRTGPSYDINGKYCESRGFVWLTYLRQFNNMHAFTTYF